MSRGKRVLVVDDDKDFCATLSRTLARKGFEVETANDPDHAIVRAREFKPDSVILDLRLGRDTGLRLIEPMLGIDPSPDILVLTAYGSIATAVEAIKRGARDYLTKPLSSKRLLSALLHDNDLLEPEQASDDPISLRRLEWEHIHRVLNENKGNISATARNLGMHRRTLQRKLQKHPTK